MLQVFRKADEQNVLDGARVRLQGLGSQVLSLSTSLAV
jgi:hypothetical protein